jgi:hypothetical protein
MRLDAVLGYVVAQHVDVPVAALRRDEPEPPVRIVLPTPLVGTQREAAVLAEADVGQPVRAVGADNAQGEVVERRPPQLACPYPRGQQRDSVAQRGEQVREQPVE